MSSINLLSYLIITYIAYIALCDRCCGINYRDLPRYKLINASARSNQPIISRTVATNVSGCERFAASKKALAFNFVAAKDRAGEREDTCQALQCPEDHNMTTLISAASYRYYSMYPTFVPSANTTLKCIPKAGMFVFSNEDLNYTQARSFCKKQNGSLAHVISEARTESLGKFVSQDIPSFVGLSNNDKERIWKNEFGEPLSCFDYRAWGEGEPSHSKGCVALVNPSDKNSRPFWRVVPCYLSLPFICEISPLLQRSSQKLL